MSAIRILIDTNVYFRLAQSFHPLLKRAFGNPPHQLYITDDLEKEFKESARLQDKFGWFNHAEYVDNRRGTLCLSKKQRQQFKGDWETVLGISNSLGYVDLSKEDINGITYALILEVVLVTDDLGMADVGSQLGVEIMSTLDLLKVMLDQGHINLASVKAVASYWSEMADCPGSLDDQFEAIFGEPFDN